MQPGAASSREVESLMARVVANRTEWAAGPGFWGVVDFGDGGLAEGPVRARVNGDLYVRFFLVRTADPDWFPEYGVTVFRIEGAPIEPWSGWDLVRLLARPGQCERGSHLASARGHGDHLLWWCYRCAAVFAWDELLRLHGPVVATWPTVPPIGSPGRSEVQSSDSSSDVQISQPGC